MYTPLTVTEKRERVEQGLRLPRSEENGHASPLPLRERMAHYRVPGVSVAVIECGAVDWVQGYGTLAAGQDAPVKADSLFHACSMSKLVTTVAALSLVADGILDLDADVNRTLTTWQVPCNDLTRANPVTLRRLLTHQSGIVDAEGSFDTLRDGEPFPPLADVLAGRTRFHDGPVQVTVEAECDFNYSDAGFCVVEQLMVDATGRRFEEIVRERVFEPLGMAHSVYQRDAALGGTVSAARGHNCHGEVVAGERAVYPYLGAAGLWSTPTDMAALLIALMHSLEANGGSILPHTLAWDLITAQGCTDWTGLGVFVGGSGQDVNIFSQGWGVGFQCLLSAYPLLGTGAVVMTNSDPGQPQSQALTGEIIRGIRHVYRWPGHAG